MKKQWLLAILLLIGICWNVAAQRGRDDASGELDVVDARQTVTRLGKQWAIFIAIDKYEEWGELIHPVNDARELKKILDEHYYIDETKELYNEKATAAAIRLLFDELKNKVEINDSVFVFHAGHGIPVENEKNSAWIPYDAGEDPNARKSWLFHREIRSRLDSLKAKHVFLISDSCYSGDFLYINRANLDPERITNIPAAYFNTSREAMSSGASETVRDESEFASRLRNTLLRTEAPYITPDFIWSYIKYVPTERKLITQPILSAIPESGHEPGGSFLFFRKNPRPGAALEYPVQAPAKNAPEPPPPAQPKPGTREFFIGSWVANIEYNGSDDTYEIELSANGKCTVKITNNKAQQEKDGIWEFEKKNNGTDTIRFKNVNFTNPAIVNQRHFNYVSYVTYGSSNNSFDFIGKAATDAPYGLQFTFLRQVK